MNGDSTRTAAGRGPLAGLRIVAIEQLGAGPFGTLFLADHRAGAFSPLDAGNGSA